MLYQYIFLLGEGSADSIFIKAKRNNLLSVGSKVTRMGGWVKKGNSNIHDTKFGTLTIVAHVSKFIST